MRTICVVTTNRSDYGRLKPIMEELRGRTDIKLQIIVGSYSYFDSVISYLRHASPESLRHSLPWYFRARLKKLLGGEQAVLRHEKLSQVIMADGFAINARLPVLLEGGTPEAMVYANSLGLAALAKIFGKLKPDIVLINGDRFEILCVAVAAAFMNIRVAHVEGGDVSGTIDNSIRHAVTKLAHIHYPATQMSAQRISRMGEDPATIFTYGSPIIDALVKMDTSLSNDWYEKNPHEVGRIDLTRPYLLIAQHPVTTEYADNYANMKVFLDALDEINMPQFFISPNIDAGSDGISVAMRDYRLGPAKSRSVFHKHVSLEDYTALLAHAAVAVGNSSSFLREAAYLGVPAVIVGTRQQFRERGENAIEVASEKSDIVHAIRTQLSHGTYEIDRRFGDGTASVHIAESLATVPFEKIPVQKYFHE